MGTEDGKSYRIQIWVAVIGVVGILGAALIGNWDKLFPPTTNLSPAATGATAPASPSPQAACTIELAAPANNTALPQRLLIDGKIEVEMLFRWYACPEATRYHLFVSSPGGLVIVNDDSVAINAYRHMFRVYGIIQPKGLTWKVRAFIEDKWGAWSEERTFDIAPPS